MCRFGASDCFARAAADVHRFVGIRVCKETLRRAVLREGAMVGKDRAAGKVPPAFTAADAAVRGADGSAGPTRLYASMDGVMVRMVTQAEQDHRRERALRKRAERKKGGAQERPLPPWRAGHAEGFKEMKVGVFYDQGGAHMHTFVTPGGPDAAGELLAGHAALLRFAQAQQRGGIIDGAPWARSQMEKRLPTIDLLLLDFYHLGEHLHGAAKVRLGDGEEAGRWADARKEEFKRGAAAEALAAIRAQRAQAKKPEAKEALRLLDQYVTERLPMLGYDRAIAQGRDIGSGPMESQRKTHTMRVDRPGAKWLAANAAAVMDLAALEASGQWKSRWKQLAA